MVKTFIVISVSDRVEMLNHLVESIVLNSRFDDYRLNLIFQDYAGSCADRIRYRGRYENIFVYPKKLGCHGARVQLLKDLDVDRYDAFINLDDDMELTQYTQYDNAINKAMEPSVGFVLTNWAKTYPLLLQKVPKMRCEFKRQTLVYQGGGMVYARKIALLMRELPVCHAYFDDIWPMTAYVNGYDNYRDMSSLAVHKICAKGGMRSYMSEKLRPLLCRDYINYRYTKDNIRVFIPVDSDINDYARQLHEQNKK